MTHGHPCGCCEPNGGLLGAGLDAVTRELGRAGFAALWQGRRLDPESLLPGSAGAADALEMLLARGRAEVDANGRVAGIHGLTLNAGRHRFEHDRGTHHTWCAFDAVGIPAALGMTAVAHSDCPTCGARIEVRLSDGVPEDSAALIWLPSGPGENLRADFCAAADLYCSVEHLEARVADNLTPGRMTDLAGAARLGWDTWADVRDLELDQARATVSRPTYAHEMARLLRWAAALYVLFAVVGRLVEGMGGVRCGCAPNCWCKRPVLSTFRWAFPYGHRG